MQFFVQVFQLDNYYKVDIRGKYKIYLYILILIGLIIFTLCTCFIGGIIMGYIVDKNNKFYLTFNLNKENWQYELDKQLSINGFKKNKSSVRNEIINKIKILETN